MRSRSIRPLLLCCAGLLSSGFQAKAAPSEAPLFLKQLQLYFPAPDREQQQVLRSLRAAIGSDVELTVDASQARAWLQNQHPATAEETLKTMCGELELARRFGQSNEILVRRTALMLALDAAKKARERGDMPLTTAIGGGFLLPHLLDAPESRRENRFEIVSALEEPFSLFELQPSEGKQLPLPNNSAAIAFERLQIALAPSPTDANWPRVRLARRLIRGNGRSIDRAASLDDASAREAFACLRLLEPGSGTLAFRYSMPYLAPRLQEKLTRAEEFDSGLAARQWNWSSNEFPWTPKDQQALDALASRCSHSEADKESILDEAAQRGGLDQKNRERLETELAKMSCLDVTQVTQDSRILDVSGFPTDIQRFYRLFFVHIWNLKRALDQGQGLDVSNAFYSLGLRTTLAQFSDPMWQGYTYEVHDGIANLRWKFGDYSFGSEIGRFTERVAETFWLDAIPRLTPNQTFPGNTNEATRALPTAFLWAFPNWKGAREKRQEAEQKAREEVQQRGEKFIEPYNVDDNARLCALALAACDVQVRSSSSQNHNDYLVIRGLIWALLAQDRTSDALLCLDGLWGRSNWKADVPSDSEYYARDLNDQLMARYSKPTLLQSEPQK